MLVVVVWFPFLGFQVIAQFLRERERENFQRVRSPLFCFFFLCFLVIFFVSSIIFSFFFSLLLFSHAPHIYRACIVRKNIYFRYFQSIFLQVNQSQKKKFRYFFSFIDCLVCLQTYDCTLFFLSSSRVLLSRNQIASSARASSYIGSEKISCWAVHIFG